MEVQIKDNKIFAPLKDKWLVLKPEEKVRQEYICRLVNSYGFDLKQMDQDSKVQGIYLNYSILIWKNKNSKINNESPLIVIQCKADSVIIKKEDYFKGLDFSREIGAKFFVATNFKQTKIYSKIYRTDSENVEEILDIPNKEEAQNIQEIEKLLNKNNTFQRENFTKTLDKCHSIIRNNDKLSPEAAFDEISKILFIKTIYERDNSKNQIFSLDIYKKEKIDFEKYRFNERKDFYQFLFEQTKKSYIDDDLFEPTEIIRIRENSFEAIVKELEIYNLSTTSDDVKGIAFEQFLGKTFRGELGQFFTPRTIVDFMVEVLDPQETETICDPCCGSGGFLIKAFEYVRAKIEAKVQQEKELIKQEYYTETYEKLSDAEKEKIDDRVNKFFSQLNEELNINNDKSRIRTLSYDCIFGTDANPRMSRTAKMNMIMHGDGHGGVHHNDGLLNVNGIFENRFDVILTNPPFGARVEKSLKITEADKYTDEERIKKYQKRYGDEYNKALKQVNNNIGKPLVSLYKMGAMSTLTEVLFIERCLNLLKPGGRMGIVLPEGVLNNSNLQKVRDYVESKAKILLIVSIPQDVFIASGATVKPSLLFFKKFTEEEALQYASIKSKATITIEAKYAEEVANIQQKLAKKGKEALPAEEEKQLKTEKKNIEAKKEREIKAIVKEEFNYTIPIAEVEKAGISTTGARIDNELEPLAKEFKKYSSENHLWGKLTESVQYDVKGEFVYRIQIADKEVGEPEIFYQKSKYENL
ncbi:N-6 DNA methylase [Bergeyella cardium]|uniref:N-6 DNA methylase n=1 Tax=Bergeyella cardium TaxID=1585976 RepID=A0A6P1QWA9_9FLAO|nr:N-6 DNA methylase [Bergeyella cardium]QHN66079.1 N-6 DNA methylase [Bergeyella cardium]WHE34595.1 N-6 DNA methylase [Bergeyella cardium]WHF61249.1 N-6 DNA methylase [Bergeyella cardium]